jgi:hypothetical protein
LPDFLPTIAGRLYQSTPRSQGCPKDRRTGALGLAEVTLCYELQENRCSGKSNVGGIEDGRERLGEPPRRQAQRSPGRIVPFESGKVILGGVVSDSMAALPSWWKVLHAAFRFCGLWG